MTNATQGVVSTGQAGEAPASEGAARSDRRTEATGEPDEIVITPEMISAGIYACRDHALGEPLSELVRKVYIAMTVSAYYTSPSASDINVLR